VLDAVGVAVAHHHVGVAGDDRLHQLHDVPAVVLVVGVGVHDHVGAELQAGVEPGLERGRQPLVVGEPHDVVHAVRTGDVDRVVGGPVVDHEPLHAVDARHLARQPGERVGQLGALVEAGDLDDQLHCKEGHKGRAGTGFHAAFTFVAFGNQSATSLLASPSSLRPGTTGASTQMTAVLAYLDPGSGSMILQIIAGGVAAVAVAAKLYWNKLLRFFHIKKDEPETETAGSETRGSTDSA